MSEQEKLVARLLTPEEIEDVSGGKAPAHCQTHSETSSHSQTSSGDC